MKLEILTIQETANLITAINLLNDELQKLSKQLQALQQGENTPAKEKKPYTGKKRGRKPKEAMAVTAPAPQTTSKVHPKPFVTAPQFKLPDGFKFDGNFNTKEARLARSRCPYVQNIGQTGYVCKRALDEYGYGTKAKCFGCTDMFRFTKIMPRIARKYKKQANTKAGE